MPSRETRLKNASDMYILTVRVCALIVAVTGDIPFLITLMENRWYPLVPNIYARDFWDILRQAALPFVF